MSLKLFYASVLNQRIKRTCVGNILILCLLSVEVWSYANINQQRFVRQLNTETAVNYEDTSMTNSYHQSHFIGNRSVVVQLFEWKFMDIAEECRNFLGPNGYAGVQLSPVLEHTIIKTSELKHPWWERYEVVSYRLASRSGDESDFWSMSRICNEQGVRIYADVVLNHMAAPLHFIGITETDKEDDFLLNTLLETNVNISQLNYFNVSYTQQDFHRPSCMILANAQDAHEIRNCQLNGHPDLDHSIENVQKQIVQMLNKFVDMGVAGFRIDTAKHIWPIDLKIILKKVKNLNTEFNFKQNSRPFIYLDVFDLGLDTISKTEYSTYGVVSEYLYSTELSIILNGRSPLSSLINWGPALGFLAHEDSLVFIDSHDTQRGLPRPLSNNHVITFKKRIKYIMANVFMLIHPYGGIKRIMSSYYYADTDINQGPPVENGNEEEIRSPEFNDKQQCTKESGWVCEHRWPELLNVLKVANYFKVPENKEESVIYFQTGGPNQVAFCRGHKAFVAMNNDPDKDFVREVFGCLEPGIYCDVVTGGKKEGEEECYGKILEINDQGYLKLELAVADNYETKDEMGEKDDNGSRTIENYGIFVIYIESKISPRAEQAAITTEGSHDGKEKNQFESKNDINEDLKDSESGSTNDAEEVNDADNEIENADNGDEKEVEKNVSEISKAEVDEEEVSKESSAMNNHSSNEAAESVQNATPSDYEISNQKEHTKDGEHSSENETEKEKEENDTTLEHDDLSKGKDSNDNKSKEKDAQSSENGGITENETEKEMKENPSIENGEEMDNQIPDDTTTANRVETEDLVEGNSAENETENDAKDIETVEGHNQSRNINEIVTKAEEQLEKPSAETVNDKNEVSEMVTAEIQNIQTAGIFSKPKGNGNNG